MAKISELWLLKCENFQHLFAFVCHFGLLLGQKKPFENVTVDSGNLLIDISPFLDKLIIIEFKP